MDKNHGLSTVGHTQVRVQTEAGGICTGLQPCQLASAPLEPTGLYPLLTRLPRGRPLKTTRNIRTVPKRRCECLRGGHIAIYMRSNIQLGIRELTFWVEGSRQGRGE